MEEYEKCECFGCDELKDGKCVSIKCTYDPTLIGERCPECPQSDSCDVALHPELYSKE